MYREKVLSVTIHVCSSMPVGICLKAVCGGRWYGRVVPACLLIQMFKKFYAMFYVMVEVCMCRCYASAACLGIEIYIQRSEETVCRMWFEVFTGVS